MDWECWFTVELTEMLEGIKDDAIWISIRTIMTQLTREKD